MRRFAILSLLTFALGQEEGEIYNLRKGVEWQLRGLCSEFIPVEIRQKSGGEGQWQLFALDLEGEGDVELLLATLEPPPVHHHHGSQEELDDRRVRRQLSGIGGDFAAWAGGGDVNKAVKRRGGDKESLNTMESNGENTSAAKGQRTKIIYLGVQPEAMKGFGRSDELRKARFKGVPVHPVPPIGLHRWTLMLTDADRF